MSIQLNLKQIKLRDVISKISIHYDCDEESRLFIYIVNILNNKKRLKTPKGQSESVNRRRTDNTRPKIKRETGQTTIYETLHRKLKIEQHESH